MTSKNNKKINNTVGSIIFEITDINFGMEDMKRDTPLVYMNTVTGETGKDWQIKTIDISVQSIAFGAAEMKCDTPDTIQ